MPYTFEPEHRFAKAYGKDMRISAKDATILCRVIRKKTLTRAKRLLQNLKDEKQTLEGKTYSHATKAMLELLKSCEKNAEFKGLELDRLMVHASATHGMIFKRRRRKAAFGSRMKATNVEIILIERGKSTAAKPKKAAKEKENVEAKKMKEDIKKAKAHAEKQKLAMDSEKEKMEAELDKMDKQSE